VRPRAGSLPFADIIWPDGWSAWQNGGDGKLKRFMETFYTNDKGG